MISLYLVAVFISKSNLDLISTLFCLLQYRHYLGNEQPKHTAM